jgi:penicillin-binding protein 1B
MHRLGIERNIQNYPSTLLGASHHTPLEVAQMYQALSNDGLLIPLRSIRNIVNHRGDVVAIFPASEVRAVDQDSAYLINYALQMVVRSGTAAALSRSFPRELGLAGKTGTTDDFRDSWFAGYSGNLLTVVWVGRDDNKPINLSGSSGAMVVWEQIMSGLDLERKVLPSNDDIVFAQVDTASGLAANNKCLNRVSIAFVQGTQPERFAPCSGLATKLKSWFSINTGALRGTTTPVEQKKK